jgi:hypothetical protein
MSARSDLRLSRTCRCERPPRPGRIAARDIAIGAELLAWAERYLLHPDPRINRPYASQTVCPFLQAALKKNAIFMAFHPEITTDSPRAVLEVVAEHMAHFASLSEETSSYPYHALLIIFPRLRPSCFGVLDKVHQIAKDDIVENGLMIGQFHPYCRTAATHNSAWRSVSVAPYPLIAMRKMVMHDILFLGGQKQWFREYARRYGASLEEVRYKSATHAFLWSTYESARERFDNKDLVEARTVSATCPKKDQTR